MKSKPLPGVIHIIIGCIILFFAIMIVFVMDNSKMRLFLVVGIGFIIFGIYRKSREKDNKSKHPQHHTQNKQQVAYNQTQQKQTHQHSQQHNPNNNHTQHATHRDIHHQQPKQHNKHHTTQNSTHNEIQDRQPNHNQNYFQNNYHACAYCGNAVHHKDKYCSNCGKQQY